MEKIVASVDPVRVDRQTSAQSGLDFMEGFFDVILPKRKNLKFS